MTQILKKQLMVLTIVSLCGGALVWNSSGLRAQIRFDRDEISRVQTSPVEVAQEFGQGLSQFKNHFSWVPEKLTSVKSKRKAENIYSLLMEMDKQWNRERLRVNLIKQDSKTALVTIENVLPPARPIYVEEENGKWGVDLIKTHARWNALEVAEKVGNRTPAPNFSLTRDGAAMRFAEALNGWRQSTSNMPRDVVEGVVSLSNQQKLGPRWPTLQFLEAMAAQWHQPVLKVKTDKSDGQSATVIVEDDSLQRPLVLVKEKDGWKVDAIQTQAAWNRAKAASQENVSDAPRDAKAKAFVANLLIQEKEDFHFFPDTPTSLKTRKQLENKVYRLNLVLAAQWNAQNLQPIVQNKGEKIATVLLKRNWPKVRPLVLVAEQQQWGVDLVETYALWNNLDAPAKADAIFGLTGVSIEGFPGDRLSSQNFKALRETVNRNSCQANMREIAQAISLYSADYDEIFPSAKSWNTDSQIYHVRSAEIFRCPALPNGSDYGYAYNSKISRKALIQISQLRQTVAVYETPLLKRNAYGLGENLAFRHQNGANYAFADGHVKWFPKTQTPSFKLKP